MRKGGIREETRDFQIISDAFYLFPTFEHQKKELIKPEFSPELDETLKVWNQDQSSVTIDTYAELVEDLEVMEQEIIDRLGPYHIWTDRFAEERLKWKRKNPLHVMLLRVYSLEHPVTLPIAASYYGCKSWIQLEADLSGINRKPVMNDTAFKEKVEQIKRLIGD
jgi:hypothetical protein